MGAIRIKEKNHGIEEKVIEAAKESLHQAGEEPDCCREAGLDRLVFSSSSAAGGVGTIGSGRVCCSASGPAHR
jgi:hypothetical protein